MSQSVQVDLGPRSYEIRIGQGLLDQLGDLCRPLGLGSSCLIISDSNVAPLYADRASRSLAKAGFRPELCIVRAGEGSKKWRVVIDLYSRALDVGLDRRSFIVALGGGVVGDLAGFVAATYLRGIRVVQAPTSLLAMVDSSVGGKTGINLPQGKNLVGAFHQPSIVVADVDALKTLPEREYLSGLAEVVKYGAIRDAGLFEALEQKADLVRRMQAALLEEIIARSCRIKADIVREDEREGGVRAILNFGHTMGHAVEQASRYKSFLHGEAVSMGMVFAGGLSMARTGFTREDFSRLTGLLKRFGLPVAMPPYSWEVLAEAMRVDKKGSDGVPKYVLLERMGAAVYGCDAPDDVLKKVWAELG